jgi:hypothetical protein
MESDKEGGWRIEDTAEIVGRTRTNVIDDLAPAKAPANFPILTNCKTKSDIKRAVKGLPGVSDSVPAFSSFDEKMKVKTDRIEIYMMQVNQAQGSGGRGAASLFVCHLLQWAQTLPPFRVVRTGP